MNAGLNQTVTLGQTATLAGQVQQAGTLPVTDQWSQVSGPGTAIFANSQTPSTTAQFTAAGTLSSACRPPTAPLPIAAR